MSAKIRRATIARDCAVDSFSHFYLIRHQCPLFHCMKQVFCNHAETLASPMFFCFSLKVFFFHLLVFNSLWFFASFFPLSFSVVEHQQFNYSSLCTRNAPNWLSFVSYDFLEKYWSLLPPPHHLPGPISLLPSPYYVCRQVFYSFLFFFNFFPELIISSILCLFLLVPLFFSWQVGFISYPSVSPVTWPVRFVLSFWSLLFTSHLMLCSSVLAVLP